MIHYFSQTGNTKLLGDFLKDNINDSKTIYVGFWTDKGNANQEALDYLKTLHHQKIFLFGTAGFGKSEEYFKRIINKVKESIDSTNEVVGSFMCQGKMPDSVLQRYLSLKEIEKQLDQRFFRCHRSYIINLDYVKSVESTKCILQNNQEIFISKKYQNDLKYHFLKNVK